MLTASPPCLLTLYLSTVLTLPSRKRFAAGCLECCRWRAWDWHLKHWLRSKATLSEPRSPSIGFEVDPESVKNLTFIDLPLSSFLSGSNIDWLARSPPTSVAKYRPFEQFTLPSAFKKKISFLPSLILLISFLIHMDFPESTFLWLLLDYQKNLFLTSLPCSVVPSPISSVAIVPSPS